MWVSVCACVYVCVQVYTTNPLHALRSTTRFIAMCTVCILQTNISDYPISFHYISPKGMYFLEYYVYHLKVYGQDPQTDDS